MEKDSRFPQRSHALMLATFVYMTLSPSLSKFIYDSCLISYLVAIKTEEHTPSFNSQVNATFDKAALISSFNFHYKKDNCCTRCASVLNVKPRKRNEAYFVEGDLTFFSFPHLIKKGEYSPRIPFTDHV